MVGALVNFGVLGLVVLWLVWLIVRRAGERRRQRWVNQLISVAGSGDAVELRELVEAGASIDTVAAQGNTALHVAYYIDRHRAIENLRACGADENLRNAEGLTPAEMGPLAQVERLLRDGVRYLEADGRWRDVGEGHAVYSLLLLRYTERIVSAALVRQLIHPEQRRQILVLAIKLGMPGSEVKLAKALHAVGDKSMAEDFLNCGSEVLREAGHQWARAHNYRISSRFAGAAVTWGQF